MSLLGSLQPFSVSHVAATANRRRLPAPSQHSPAVDVVLSDPFPSAALAVGLLRTAAPLDFPRDRPVYLLSARDVPHSWQTGAGTRPWWAFASNPGHNVTLRNELQSRGVYRGPGFAAVFRDGWVHQFGGNDDRERFGKGLALFVHEAAHELSRFKGNERSQRAGRSHDAAVAAYHRDVGRSHAAHRHDGPFIRAALHLHHRVSALWPIDVDAVQIGGDSYGLADARLFRLALAGELTGRAAEPVGTIIRSDPPAMFAGFWKEQLNQRNTGAFQ